MVVNQVDNQERADQRRDEQRHFNDRKQQLAAPSLLQQHRQRVADHNGNQRGQHRNLNREKQRVGKHLIGKGGPILGCKHAFPGIVDHTDALQHHKYKAQQDKRRHVSETGQKQQISPLKFFLFHACSTSITCSLARDTANRMAVPG